MPNIAAVTTIYRKWSHADVILSKILGGYSHPGLPPSKLKLVSLVVDQDDPNDLSRDLARHYGFRLCKTVEEALTLGGDKLAVDGVMCIGEHGVYPNNANGQTLYPRRRFFEQVTDLFAKCKRSVPVFNDKHLSATWADAKWMVDRARELRVPFMAGSSVPLTWRKPSLTLPMKSVLQGAVQIGYGPFEGYGYHALEGMQSAVERRLGGETGVAAVTCLQGEKMWQPFDANPSLKAMLDSGMKHVTAHAQGDFRKIAQADKQSASWLIEYRDGLKAVVAMLNGWVHEGDGGAFIFAGQVKNQPISAWQFYLQQPDPFAHFAYQIAAFEAMVRTGQAPYPIERTLLTTGILDAVMISQAEGNRRVETPYLNFAYAPTDWPFATDPIPLALPSR